jgi:hypothetical protein
MALKQFIEQLTIDLQSEQALDANEDGSYSLHLEPDIHVTLKEAGNAYIMLHTRVADFPPNDVEQYLLGTMIGNLFGRETGGALLGLDKEGKQVVMLDFLPQEMNYRTFHECLEDFVNYTESWRQETIEFVKRAKEVEE